MNQGQEKATQALVIRNGFVADHQSTQVADILIKDGKIAEIAPNICIDELNCSEIDVKGKYVMPGGIDVHTHFNIDMGFTRSCDDFYSGTVAAACGGTTTIIDHMGFGPKGCDLFHQLGVYKQYARDKAVIDYSFHGVIQHIDDQILAQMRPMVEEEGISSFKLYLTYQHKLEDESVFRALTELNKVGALTTVHPENDATIAIKRQQFLEAGKTSAKYHALSRPLECEAEAIARMINLAKLADDAPLYIVHLSNGLGLDYARMARANQQAVWVETCTQYLLLDDSCYLKEDALKYILSPPLRPEAEKEKLWAGIVDGSIDTVATDHCNFTYAQQKQLGRDNFSRCPNGMPGVEVRMPLLFSEGVMKGRIDIQRFVELNAYQPAKLFGLYPQKGSLQIGADADLVIFDSTIRTEISHAKLHDNSDYTPFEAMECHGWPVMTISRGEIVARDGKFTGQAGYGKFLHRQPFDQKAEFNHLLN